MAKRFHPYLEIWQKDHFEPFSGVKDPFVPTFHPERLEQPLAVKKPSKIFVCSTADLFGDWVPREWIEAVLEIVRRAPWHRFQLLTKNPGRLSEFKSWPDNVWMGATATDGKSFSIAMDGLRQARTGGLRFISVEPMLGEIPDYLVAWSWIRLDWLIIGAMTGRHAKVHPCQREWVMELEGEAGPLDIPVWEKDSLGPVLSNVLFPRPLRKEWPINERRPR